jgi:iron complex outermembrane receptor protein
MLVAALLIGLVAGAAPCAFAQTEAEGEEFILEEITVTAQKREENQQKVPIAMEVVSGEDLVSMGRNNVDEILKNIANVSINTAADGMRISMRGLADDSNVMDGQHVGGSTVSINIDGAYNNMSNAGQNLFDLERVEVLFGPQSTMYGSNAPGGIVNVVTANPKTDKFSANASIEYGSYSLLNLQAVLNIPVVQDVFALRLAANTSQQDSFVDTDIKAADNTAARLKALWQPNEDLVFTVTGNWSESANNGMMGGSVKPFVDQDDDYYPDGTPFTDPWTADDASEKNSNDQTTKSISADINWSTQYGTVSFVPSYNESESEGYKTETSEDPPGSGNMQTETSFQTDSTTQKGAELRMTNAEDFELFEWIFGGTWYESEQARTNDYEDAGSVDTSRETTQNKKALYANITYPLWFNDKLALTFGYRQSWDENNSTSEGDAMAGDSGNPKEYSKPDLKFGFEYDASDNIMYYGSYSSSYRSGDAMAMPDAGGDYPDPEELDAYTLGAKSRWLDNRLQVNIAAYYYDYENKLCTGYKEATGLTEYDLGDDYISVGVDGRGNPSVTLEPDGQYPTMDDETDMDQDGEINDIYNFQINDPNSQGTGAFESLGIDLQTTWLITSRDRLNVSVSYLDAEWKTLSFHYYYSMYWPDENYEGVTPTNSPEWSVTTSYEHNFMLGSLGTLTPRIDMQYKTEMSMVWNPADKDPEGYGRQEAYSMWDASASFQHASGRWSLNAYIKNITDYAVKRSYMGMMDYSLMIGDPRTYGATFSMRF